MQFIRNYWGVKELKSHKHNGIHSESSGNIGQNWRSVNLNNSSLGKMSDSNENETDNEITVTMGTFCAKNVDEATRKRRKRKLTAFCLFLAAKSPFKCHLNSNFQLFLFFAVYCAYSRFVHFVRLYLPLWMRCSLYFSFVECLMFSLRGRIFFLLFPNSPWRTNIHYHVNLLLFHKQTPVRCHGYKMQILILLNLST